MSYPYATGDLLEQRNTYFYSAYAGRPFLKAWTAAREPLVQGASSQAPAAAPGASFRDAEGKYLTDAVLEWLLAAFDSKNLSSEVLELAAKMIQRFEVSKRVHAIYTPACRALEGADYQTPERYLRYAEVMSAGYQVSARLPFLNVLLKCLDTLTVLRHRLDSAGLGRLARLARLERQWVAALETRASGVIRAAQSDRGESAAPSASAQSPIPGLLFLAANTARSRAYAQAMAARGLRPEKVLLMGAAPANPFAAAPAGDGEVFLPDLSVPVEETCRRHHWPLESRPELRDVNGPEVLALVKATQPTCIVYSGFGGQLVGKELLCAAPFLHAHAGWLPDYRGSTTLYYSVLQEGRCGVTVFWLDPGIDSGALLARRHYPAPPPGTDIDHVYDNALRADLLVRVLSEKAESGQFPKALPAEGEGDTFYVIHPTLKHIALLCLDARAG